jgi:hypothetical protein
MVIVVGLANAPAGTTMDDPAMVIEPPFGPIVLDALDGGEVAALQPNPRTNAAVAQINLPTQAVTRLLESGNARPF